MPNRLSVATYFNRCCRQWQLLQFEHIHSWLLRMARLHAGLTAGPIEHVVSSLVAATPGYYGGHGSDYDMYGGGGHSYDYGHGPSHGYGSGYGYGHGYDQGYGSAPGYDPYGQGGYGGYPPQESYAGGEYRDEPSWQERGYGGGEGSAVEGEEPEQEADYGEIDPRLGQGKDPALGPDIVDGLRDVHDKIKDVREALNMYRIVKADGARAMQQLEKIPRQMPGGVPWASALDLEHVVEKTKYIPAADFDNLINGMHVMQLSLADTLRNYLMKKAAAHEAARESMSEAAEAAREAADLIRGANPDATPPPDQDLALDEPMYPEDYGYDDDYAYAAGAAPGEGVDEIPPGTKLEDLPALNDVAELNNEGVDLEKERELMYDDNMENQMSKISSAPWLLSTLSWQMPNALRSQQRRRSHDRFLAAVMCQADAVLKSKHGAVPI